MCQACFALAVALLGCGGLDALGELPPQLHARLRPLMRLAWQDGRNARLRVWFLRQPAWPELLHRAAYGVVPRGLCFTGS